MKTFQYTFVQEGEIHTDTMQATSEKGLRWWISKYRPNISLLYIVCGPVSESRKIQRNSDHSNNHKG